MGEHKTIPWLKGAGLVLLMGLQGSPAMALEARIVVEAAGQEDPPLALVRTKLVTGGMSQSSVDQIVRGFDNYIHERIHAGKKIVLFPEATVLLARAASRQGWSGEEVCTFLVYVQGTLEDDKESASALTQHALHAVRSNKSAQAAMARLEEGAAVRRSMR